MPKMFADLLKTTNGRKILAAAALILGLSAACSLPGVGGESAAALPQTAIAETVAARRAAGTGTALAEAGEGTGAGESPAPSPSVASTSTPVPTSTAVPSQTSTPTPDVPLVRVSGNTFCRYGPGEVYQGLGILNTDQESEILAQDPTGNFWYITNPDQQGESCWIWGGYATPEGPTDRLPVYTPPPTPTPSLGITASFNYVCGSWYFDFTVQNTGSVALESYQISLLDDTTNNAVATQVNGWPGGCTGGGPDTLDPGQTGRAYAEFLSNDPLGHTIKAALKACTGENLSGTCTTHEFNFTAAR